MAERPPFRNTVDCILYCGNNVVLIERAKPPKGFALPGGHLEADETLEQAVVREVKEETGLDVVGLRQFKTYSDPNRDPRGRAITTVFVAHALGKPKAGSDAKRVRLVPLDELALLDADMAFDHHRILTEYRSRIRW